jgi:hypothetical protein
MTETECFEADDALRMIEALWQLHHDDVPGLERQLHRYYLACCRAIWKLLTQEGSRNGVIVAERHLAGELSTEELYKANYDCEGAAFNIDYNCDPEAIQGWVEQTRAIPVEELRDMLHPPEAAVLIETRELLKRAAYFADYAMISESLIPKGPPRSTYALFLSASLLREMFGNPFRSVSAKRD